VRAADIGKRPHKVMLTRLLALAAHALAEVAFINANVCYLHLHKSLLFVMYNVNYLGRE
jgi:hypothetical protein